MDIETASGKLEKALQDAERLQGSPYGESYDKFLMTCLEIMTCVGQCVQEMQSKDKSCDPMVATTCRCCKIRPGDFDGLCGVCIGYNK